MDAEVYAKAVEIFERRRVEAGQPRARLSSRPQQVLGEMPYTHPGLEKQVEAVSERVGAASQRIEDVVRHISSGTDDRLGGLRESLARIEEQLAKQTARRNFSKGVSEVPTGIEERFFRFARKSWRRAIDLLRRIKR